MKTRSKNIFIFVLIITLSGAVYAWFYPLNKGKISITLGMTDYLAYVGDQVNSCPSDPCLLSLKTGSYFIKVQKDRFFPETKSVVVTRFQTSLLAFNLKKIPSLIPSPVVPSYKETVGPKSAYWDSVDQRVKVKEGEITKVITLITDASDSINFVWAPNQSLLLGIDGKNLYFIDTAKASRKKVILGFAPTSPLWSNTSDFVLVNDAKSNLIKITPDQKITPLNIQLNLGNALISQDGKIIYYTVDSQQNKTAIKSFNPDDATDTEIVTKYNFPISKITQDINRTIYFYNPTEENWYQLEA